MLSRVFYKLALFALVSTAVLPTDNLSAASCDPCCDEESFWCSTRGCLIGGALLGAAAGAGTGYAAGHGNNHRGKRGFTGPTGPTGPLGPTGPTGPTGPIGTFAVDTDETLTFTPVLNVTVSGIGATVTPFVSLPDGTVLEGAATPIIAIGANNFPPIVIDPAMFGEYAAGFQINGGPLGITAIITESVASSRSGTTTIVTNPTPVVIGVNGNGQSSVNFAYGDPPVP